MKLFGFINEWNKYIIYIFGIKISIKKIIAKKKDITFKTFQEMASIIKANLHKLPNDIDLVVGVPRSGVIPAYIIALFLNKRVCSLNEFVNNLMPLKGERFVEQNEIKKVLIVDDSINTGSALIKTKLMLDKSGLSSKYNLEYCCVFATTKSKKLVDYFFEVIDGRRLFQWNYLNHSISNKCCFDMDGVLCIDPTEEQNDDDKKYLDFILNAKPLFIPQYEIHSIVTSRLEKYRKPTQEWLKKHNVKYKQLIMLNLESAEERRKLNCHATFKASIYKKLKDTICFIESDPKQAEQIALIAKKQCICVSTDEYFSGKI